MLQVLTFTLAVVRPHGVELPEVQNAIRRSVQFLRAIQDDVSGLVPRYGHDDGALVFPWTGCTYEDFRPAVQEAAAVLGEPLPWLIGDVLDQGYLLAGPFQIVGNARRVCGRTGRHPEKWWVRGF